MNGGIVTRCLRARSCCSVPRVITDIEELDVAILARAEEPKLAFFARQHGLKYWKADISDYIAMLQKERLRGWRIDSAIGFGGFVIARSVEESA